MLTSTMGFSSQPNAMHTYAKNLGAAARDFVAALLAIKPVNENAPEAVVQRAPASDELSLFRLYRLASRADSYDSVSPELVKELRLIAARG